nr:peptide ABC transporter substrate-binding protein [Hephaestia sp. MAHUQ-44]
MSDPGSLDPARSFVKQDQTILVDLLTGLTTFDAQGRIVPGLATHWETSPDGLVWTFHMREAQWSDGAPITAADVVFSMRRIVDPVTAGSYASLLYPVLNAEPINIGKAPVDSLGVTAPDPHTLVIRLVHPAPYLPSLLTHYGLLPVPEHAVRRWGDDWTRPGRFVSSGAYRLAEWRLGDHLTLVRNPRFYAADDVCLDRVDYYPSPNATLAERRVRRGELDWHPTFDATRTAYLRGPGGIPDYVRTHAFGHIIYMAFNLRDPAFADIRVRRAIAMAIDRDFIAGKVLTAGQRPTYSFVPTSLGALPADPPWADLDFDSRRALATRLMADAGYTRDHPLKIEIKSIIGIGTPAAIAADLRAIGVDARLSVADIAVFFSDLQLGGFQLAYTDWIADYPDPTNFLNLLRTGNSANYGGYANPAYDALIARAEAEADLDRRATLLQTAERQMLLDAPVAPVFVNAAGNLVNPRVTGWHDNRDDVHLMRYACVS